MVDEDAGTYRAKGFRYPRPYSEPPSPLSSRPTTPGTSVRGDSDDEGEDEVDSENEVRKLDERSSTRRYFLAEHQ